MELNDVLTIMIPSAISIIGFVVTFISNKQVHKQNINTMKSQKQIDELLGLPKDIFELIHLLELIIAGQVHRKKDFDSLKESITAKTICYGSVDSVKIVTCTIEIMYRCLDDKEKFNHRHLIALYVMLAMQIKYDTTGIKTSPQVWYKGRYTTKQMTEVYNFYEESMKIINDFVDELKLSSFLKVKKDIF